MARPAMVLQDKSKAKVPVFQVEVSGDLGPYKTGEFLSRKEHIAEYFRLSMNEGRDEVDNTLLTDDQIVECVKGVNVEGLDADDADVVRYEALETIEGDTGTAPETAEVTASTPSNAATAIKYGHMVTPEFEAAIARGVDGKKEYDGAPIMLKKYLDDIFGTVKDADGTPVMLTWPRIGSRLQGSKNDNVAKGFNGPVDFYVAKDKVTNKEIKGRWLNHFVDAMPHGRAKLLEISQVRALQKDSRNPLPNTPRHILDMQDSAEKRDSAYKDATAERANYINRVGRAIAYWQQVHRIETEMPRVGVRMAVEGEPLERASKRNKPIRLVSRTKNASGEWENTTAELMSLTKFINLKVDKAKMSGGTTAALLETAKKGKSEAKTGPTATVAAIQTFGQFQEHFSNVYNYISGGDKSLLILQACLDKEDEGETAAAICSVFDLLMDIEPKIRPIAMAHADRLASAAANEARDMVAAKDKAA